MKAAWILEPASAAAPCGPDLDEVNDPDFLDYYYNALGRLPDGYVNLVSETPYDPARVDLRREGARIESLLRRSRDLRLLVLQLQWELLAGQLIPAADTLEALPGLIEQWGDAVHPRIDPSPAARRAALAELAAQPTVLQPLLHAGLTGNVSLRRILVASRAEPPRSYEQDLVGTDMASLLASREVRREVAAAHGALLRIAGAAARLQSLCESHPHAAFSPNTGPLRALAEQALSTIAAAVPELAAAAPPPAAPLPTAAPAAAEEGAPQPAPLPADAPASHEEARGLLLSCERYFAERERSSASLILVRQALELWGRPLVEAMEVLLPQQVQTAAIDFGPAGGFRIPIERMRSLSPPAQPATSDPSGDPSADPPAEAVPLPASRAEVGQALRAVEAFFAAREPSSPIPLLLQRARALLDKSFEALMGELIPKPPA